MKPSIHFFQRKRREGKNFSLEQVFEGLRTRISDSFTVKLITAPYISSGVIKRFLNTVLAVGKQGDINHITGDINYVNLLLNKKKNVLTILDCGVLHSVGGIKKWIINLIWYKLPVKMSTIVTVISNATKVDLMLHTGCNPDKLKVIYVPISDDFKPVLKQFNSSNPRILQIGGAPNKNLSRLIEAVTGLNCVLAIIGTISEDNVKLLKEHNVAYENYVGIPFARIIEEYSKCDLLFFASTFEGFGMPILEAQATGRPVITSNILSMPEVGGDAALYVDPYSISDIRNGIDEIIQNESYRERLIQLGLDNVKRFDPAVIASQYIGVYNQLLQH
ncbi:MAG: glycosyltransferase involved in cell wall biosynthesis [bacterium]|jgi:glycosyltransferase involved in cell wall biosynthesis